VREEDAPGRRRAALPTGVPLHTREWVGLTLVVDLVALQGVTLLF
jgi:hypothetical protein